MKRHLLKSMLLLCALIVGGSSVWADEIVTYTLDPVSTGGNSSPHNNYGAAATTTIDEIEWSVTGNSNMVPWRIGGKNISDENREIYSKNKISDDVTKIEVTHGSASNITVNSWTIIVSKNSDFTNPVSELTPDFEAEKTTTINRPEGKDWSNCYYKFIYNVTVSGTSNRFLQFTKAEFYKTVAAGSHTLTAVVNPVGAGTVTLGADNLAESGTTTATATANSHFTFTSWSIAGTGASLSATNANPTTVTMGTTDVTITANFTEDTKYSVTYKANNGGTDNDVVFEYYGGENVIVAANNFIYNGHSFTKWNTEANGSGTDYSPGATISNISANIDLYAQWEESNEIVDVLTYSLIGVTGTNYEEWSEKRSTSTAVYAGKTAGGNNSIQLNSTTTNGIISTTSGGYVRKVILTWNSNTQSGRKVIVYGSNSAFSSISDMTSKEKLGEIAVGSTELEISDNYAYVGMVGNGGACYMDEIRIIWGPDPSAATTVIIDESGITNTNKYVSDNAGSLSATVKAGDTVIDGATVTWSSSDEGVATIGENTGVVTLVAAGSATITASYAGVADQYKSSFATYSLTVTNASLDATTASMTSFSAISGNVNSDANVSYYAEKGNAGTAPAVNNGEIRIYQNGGLLTVTGNGHKLNKVTIGSSMTTKVTYAIDGGEASAEQNITADGTLEIDNINGYIIVFTCTGTDKTSRLYLNNLSVEYENTADYTFDLTIATSGYSSLCLPTRVSQPTGVTVFVATAADATNGVTLESIDGAIPANTGVIVKGTPGTKYTFSGTSDAAATFTTNLLTGTLVAKNFQGIAGAYMLKGGLFCPIEGGTLAANKAYLTGISGGSGGAIGLRFGDATMIEGVVAPEENVIYDLTGRRVENVTKGIYIVNGKKVLVK